MTADSERAYKLNGQEFSIKAPAVMGILNLTPDSFSDGGEFLKTEDAVKHAEAMLSHGAQIIDIGAESTRPGSAGISVEEELERLIPVLEKMPMDRVLVSVDSSKIEVQKEALKYGVHIINDILGGSDELYQEAEKYKAGLVLMHTSAPPAEMQNHTDYNDVVADLISYFKNKEEELSRYDLPVIYFDPGIGFGKTADQNLQLMRECEKFSELKYPLLIGSSRKSWIGALCGAEVNERLGASLASIVSCYYKGAEIFRVHDVYESVQALKAAEAIK